MKLRIFNLSRLVLMCVALVPSASCFAQFSGAGSGTKMDPYLIENAKQLDEVRETPTTSFKLINDIDLTEFIAQHYPKHGWLAINFTGNFDGNGKSITGLTIDDNGGNGLFNIIYPKQHVTIKNLTVKGNVTGGDGVGGIIGIINATYFSIENCHFSGSVEGSANVGGIIGKCNCSGHFNVSKCSNKGSVKEGKNGLRIGRIGGIVGYMRGEGNIYDSSFSGNIVSSTYTGAGVGGIVGEAESDPYRESKIGVYRCEFIGEITGNTGVGGVAGKVTNCDIESSVSNAFIYGKTDVGGVLGNGVKTFCRDCSFTGYLQGVTGCGGIVGTFDSPNSNSIYTCYTYSYITGQSEIGGILGRKKSNFVSFNIANCFVLSPQIISISNDNKIARVAHDFSGDIFTRYSYALRTTKIIKEGTWDNHIIDNYQNGGQISETAAKKKAPYVVGKRDWGYWDFDEIWSIQENASYPYLQWQTTPPVISSKLKAGDTSIKGICAEDGTIYARVGDKIYSSSIHQSQWQINVPPLHSGEKIEVYSKSENKQYSNWIMTTVKYEGEGTAESPYQISTAEDLLNIWQGGYYRLTKDIEFDSCLLSPIIYVVDDTVTIDGDGHKITILKKQSDSYSYISDEDIGPYDNTGLFGIGYNVTLKKLIIAFPRDYTLEGRANVGGFVGLGKNLNLSQCAFYGNIDGRNCIGSLVGRAKDSHIIESYAEGTIEGGGFGYIYVGGLAGYAENTVIGDCISKSDIHYRDYSGGIVGTNMSVVRNCYATGNIDAQSSGGICGLNKGTNATVSNCFAMNKNIRSGNRVIGSLLNPLIGPILTPIPDSINYAWDGMIIKTVINDGVPMNGYSKTNEQLMQRSTYETCGWDFDNVWGIDEGKGYPYLQWMRENVHTGIQKVATSGAQNKALISLARERIMIDCRGTSLPVAVYNLLGIRVYNGIVNGHLSIHLTSGTYIVVAGNQTKKVVL